MAFNNNIASTNNVNNVVSNNVSNLPSNNVNNLKNLVNNKAYDVNDLNNNMNVLTN